MSIGWEGLMTPCFAEVLARESVRLAGVADRTMLVRWRHCVVEELMSPQSPYALAMRLTDDVHDRADFLDRWRELITEAVDRVMSSDAADENNCSTAQAPKVSADAQKTAVLILAALHGGSALSHLSRGPRPLDAALDLALVPLVAGIEENIVSEAGTNGPISSMDS